MVGETGKRNGRLDFGRNTPRFYLRQDLCIELGLHSDENKKNLVASSL